MDTLLPLFIASVVFQYLTQSKFIERHKILVPKKISFSGRKILVVKTSFSGHNIGLLIERCSTILRNTIHLTPSTSAIMFKPFYSYIETHCLSIYNLAYNTIRLGCSIPATLGTPTWHIKIHLINQSENWVHWIVKQPSISSAMFSLIEKLYYITMPGSFPHKRKLVLPEMVNGSDGFDYFRGVVWIKS